MVQTTNTRRICADIRQSCNGQCSGYGTCTDCPPLIVLAVLSAQPMSAVATPGKSSMMGDSTKAVFRMLPTVDES